MNCTTELRHGMICVNIDGEMDMVMAKEFCRQVDELLDKYDLSELIVNFSRVSFIDSAGIGALLGRYKKMHLRQGRMCLTGVQENVKRVLLLSGILKLMKIYPDEVTAIQQI